MSVTVTQVRRAVEEVSICPAMIGQADICLALNKVLASPLALTLLANSINQKTGAKLEVQNCLAWTDEERQADARRAKNHAVGFGE